jgi:adenine-specific DNA-methyltransferase
MSADSGRDEELEHALLAHVPEDGSTIGNTRLRRALGGHLGREIDEATYFAAQRALVDDGVLIRGAGRGGSVRRAQPDSDDGLTLEAQEIPEAARRPKPKQDGLPIGKRRRPGVPERPKKDEGGERVIAYRHRDTRPNNPEVGMVTPDNDDADRTSRWAYDPHLSPELRFDVGRAEIETLIDDALASGDADVQRETLETLKRMAAPYLNWAGKAERTSFEVDLVSLHVHERIDPATILGAVRRRMEGTKDEPANQSDLFRAWFEEPLPYREAIEFYRHDRGWANRLIAGDSLLVMNSLLEKEGMAGQVQMIYIDPPYGIRYGSNFQPFVNKRDVKDRKDEDLTQEPEMIKAFRDTWELVGHAVNRVTHLWHAQRPPGCCRRSSSTGTVSRSDGSPTSVPARS